MGETKGRGPDRAPRRLEAPLGCDGVGLRLRAALREKGYSLSGFAKQLGVSHVRITKIATSTPAGDLAIKIVEELGAAGDLTVADLVIRDRGPVALLSSARPSSALVAALLEKLGEGSAEDLLRQARLAYPSTAQKT